SKLPRLADPFERRDPDDLPGISVNLAVVWRDAGGSFRSEVTSPSGVIRAGTGFDQSKSASKILHRDQVVLEESPRVHAESQQNSGGSDSAGGEFMFRRSHLEGERTEASGAVKRVLDTYSLGADYRRFNISLNVGNGGNVGEPAVASFSGMVRHDLALPLVDTIVFAGDAESDALTHLNAHVEGVRALRRFHADAGRARVASLYGDI